MEHRFTTMVCLRGDLSDIKRISFPLIQDIYLYQFDHDQNYSNAVIWYTTKQLLPAKIIFKSDRKFQEPSYANLEIPRFYQFWFKDHQIDIKLVSKATLDWRDFLGSSNPIVLSRKLTEKTQLKTSQFASADLIQEIAIDNWRDIFSRLSLVDMGRLALVNKFFNQISEDETFWQKKASPYNISAAIHGGKAWKKLYIELSTSVFYTWGRNHFKAIENFSKTTVMKPMVMNFPDVTRIVQVSFAAANTLALSIGGIAYIKGGPILFPEDAFSQIDEFKPFDDNVTQICCGFKHALILHKNGSVFGFGQKENYPLGDITNYEKHTLRFIPAYKIPTKPLTKIRQVACGSWTSCIVGGKEEGCLVFGDNEKYQLGISNLKNVHSPTQILNGHTISQIVFGDSHGIALTDENRVFVWGDNGFGQLGVGANIPFYDKPTELILKNCTVIQISAGANHTAFLYESGSVATTGIGNDYRLGVDVQILYRPQVIKTLPPIIQISCGDYHTVCLDKEGQLWTFGSNEDGMLGREKKKSMDLPGKVFSTQFKVKHSFSGFRHTACFGKMEIWHPPEEILKGKKVVKLPESHDSYPFDDI